MAAEDKLKEYTMAEVARHNSGDDVWLAIRGKVYSVGKFLPDHPGGPEIVTAEAGTDATVPFDDVFHSAAAQEQLEEYLIGKVKGYDPSSHGPPPGVGASSESGGSALLYFVPLLIIIIGVVLKYLKTE